ncbi:ArsR/SmtB family transcription factor [Brevibacterium sp. CFH 10365]|uniref:ArsR/SmtB family transcription factor n=1 Tax=Brevibacterium sp. CFH 10365 TaxID=2585207 RepID=UPI0018793280|nr:DUF5937 family protein [Brevibacterium sp. CFH 10365]
MTIVFKLQSFSSSQLHVVVSPLAEMMAVLHSMAEPDHHLEARSMLNEISESVDDAYLREFNFLSPLWARFRCRLFFPFAPKSQGLTAELEAIAALPDHAFIELCAEGVQGMRGPIPAVDTLLADTPERAGFLDYCLSRSNARHDLAIALLEGPAKLRARLLRFLVETNTRFFAREWMRVREEISTAAAFHHHQIRTLSNGESLSSLHHSAHHEPAFDEIRIDKLQNYSVALKNREVIAVPSVRIGSHLTVKWESAQPVIIHFPVRTSTTEPMGIERMRQRLAALNSDFRIELFRHLVGEPITTSELAARMNQTAAQTSRELRVLREANLLVSERRGKRIFHRVDVDKIIQLGPDLLSTVLR